MLINNKKLPIITIIDTTVFSDEDIDKFRQYADDYIINRNNPKKQDIKNSIIGCVIRKLLIKKYFNIPYSNQNIIFNKHGKPMLKDVTNVHFNISHDETYVVCAIHNEEIGIDIQKIIPCNNKIADYIFTNEEKMYLDKSLNKNYDFSKIWSSKESAVKLVGCGMAFHTTINYSTIETKHIDMKDYVISYSTYKKTTRQ